MEDAHITSYHSLHALKTETKKCIYVSRLMVPPDQMDILRIFDLQKTIVTRVEGRLTEEMLPTVKIRVPKL